MWNSLWIIRYISQRLSEIYSKAVKRNKTYVKQLSLILKEDEKNKNIYSVS